MPFAPGDLVLAIGGIAIASGRVNPVVMVGLTYLATVAGAILGRELFALVGWERLMRVARPLHAEKPLQRASEMLQRSGWRAVFTARLIPGLRIHTTQVAGVTRMRRAAFYRGLLPAAAVFVGGFIGLGAAFGRPILALIHQTQHQVILGALALAATIVLVLVVRARLRRILESLATGGWTGPLRIRLDPLHITVIPLCIGINFGGHALVVYLKLPLFLDSAGTILSGVVAGPWVGGSVGFLSNLLTSNTFEPIAALYSIVSFAVGFAAGLSRYLNWQRRASGWILLWAVCVAISSVVSTPINLLINDGHSGVQLGDSLFAWLVGAHVPSALAAFIGEAAIDLPDKAISAVAALLIAQALARQPAQAGAIDLDLRDSFVFVFRSRRWIRKILAGALCLLFTWLIVPGLLLLGYLVAVARTTRAGTAELPAWDGLWGKVKDGFKVAILYLVWVGPGILLSIPAGIVTDADFKAAFPDIAAATGSASAVLSVIGNLWQFFAALIQPAVWSEYLEGGFRAGLRPGAIYRRLRINLALTIVIGALSIVLSVIAIVGVIGVLVGVLVTTVYVGLVWAHLVGIYARITDRFPVGSRMTARQAAA